ncbi:TolC family outer membrane protein [Amphritea sp.]|uniref:TolC family outer membrane protein n=1 Tax=Amphritea sp. TaxID=1872502 RepID=UPI003D0AEAF5
MRLQGGDMLNHKLIRILASTGFCSALICSTQVQAEDLMAIWKVAEKNDTKYLSAYHKLRADQEIINLSRADLLPTISFQYEHKETSQTINESDNAVFYGSSADYPTDRYGLTLTQSIFDYSRWQRYDQSKISASRAEVEYKLSKQQLLLRLSESYFLVLERSDQLQAIEAEKKAMLKHFEVSEKKHKTGLVRTVDLQDASARYLNALSKEIELQSRLTDSRYALRESLGSMPGNLARLRSDVKLEMPVPSDPEEWVRLAAKNNPELQALNLSLNEADKEIKALRGGHYPTLDLLLTHGNEAKEGSPFGGTSDIDTTEVTVQLNVPLYSGGKTSAKVRQAIEKRNSVLEDRNDKQRMVERSTHDAYHRISEAIVQIGALEKSLQAQESRLKSKSAGYRSGQNSLVEVLDVEQDFSDARQALIKARYDYVLNVLRLKFAVGALQEEDLSAINNWLTNDQS